MRVTYYNFGLVVLARPFLFITTRRFFLYRDYFVNKLYFTKWVWSAKTLACNGFGAIVAPWKTKHSVMLTEWLLENNPDCFAELVLFLQRILDAGKATVSWRECSRHQHPHLTKPKPNPTRPPCPHSLSAIAVSSTAATHTSSAPSIRRAPTRTIAPTFKKTPTPRRRNYGNPKVQATTTANWFCNARQRWTPEQQLELLDTHPLFTGRCPRCEITYPQYETPSVHWDCSACGWMDDSVWGDG